MNALLNWMEGMSQGVTITEDNFEELQNLCEELGFRGLDEELRAFRRGTGSNPVESNEVLHLKERIARQEKRLTELERQLSEVLRRNRKMESDIQASVSRQFQTLARRIEEVARVCERTKVAYSNVLSSDSLCSTNLDVSVPVRVSQCYRIELNLSLSFKISRCCQPAGQLTLPAESSFCEEKLCVKTIECLIVNELRQIAAIILNGKIGKLREKSDRTCNLFQNRWNSHKKLVAWAENLRFILWRTSCMEAELQPQRTLTMMNLFLRTLSCDVGPDGIRGRARLPTMRDKELKWT